MNRLALTALLALVPLLSAGGLGNVSVGDGTATLPIGDQPVGERIGGSCPAYPSTPTFWIAARKETAYADNDPASPLTDFGTLGLDVTSPSGPSTPTFKSPCVSGVANDQPCFDGDGGDFSWRPSAEAAFKFLHDGTGMTCALVAEQDNATACAMIDSGAWSSSDVGVMWYWSGASSQSGLGASRGVPGSLAFGYEPNSVTVATGLTYSTIIQHATANTPDWATWRDGTARDSGAYAGPTSTATATGPLTILGRWSGLNACNAKFYELACWASGSVDVSAVQSTLECEYGGAFPQVQSPPSPAPIVSVSLVEPLASTTSVRSRGLRAAFALIQQGYKPAQVITFVAGRLGVDEQTAREEVRKVWGRKGLGRIDATLRTEHVGLLVPTAELPIIREVLAWTMCYPLGNCGDNESLADCRARGDQTFEPLLTQCLQRERQSLGERFCSSGTSTEVGRGDRLRLTADQWAKLVEADADAPAHPGTRVIRNATDARYEQLWQNRGVERCPEEQPQP